jgi:hypothetical protein
VSKTPSQTPSRHDQLISAGWRYDDAQNRYAAPGGATDGTERWYNQDAAWAQQQTLTSEAASKAPPLHRQRDPRRQEPQ